MLEGKKILITGGSGSFAVSLLEHLAGQSGIGEIRLYSRGIIDDSMLINSYPTLNIIVFRGDINDQNALELAMRGCDYVFHAAALKGVPECEADPVMAKKTNVDGSILVFEMAGRLGVAKLVALSTDKAAYPIGVMGATKLLMEKMAWYYAAKFPETTYICTRYGNVWCTKNTVIPLFVKQIKAGKTLTVTDDKMTRFVMTPAEAIDLVLFALEFGHSGEIVVRNSPACTVGDLAMALSELFNGNNALNIIGLRPGEKLNESMLTNEECLESWSIGEYIVVKPGSKSSTKPAIQEYNSDTAKRLNQFEVAEKLRTINYINEELKN